MTFLETERLLLRRPERRDIPAIVPLANNYDVAKNLSKLPHPYTAQDGEDYVANVEKQWAAGSDFPFSITRKSDGALIGGCGLHPKNGGVFEFGYWLGQPFWKQGYATEAARRLVVYAFQDLQAARVWAGWYWDNPASGHVLSKVGCTPTGQEKRPCLARGVDVDCNIAVLSREEFLNRRAA